MDCITKDVDNICRICFKKQYDTISLYSKKDGVSLYEKLINNTKLNITANDGGPNVICGQCLNELNICVEFLKKCNIANKLLIEYKQNKDVLKNNGSHLYEDEEKHFKNYSSDQGNEDKICVSVGENVAYCKANGSCSDSEKHICQYCSKAFTRKFNLKLHLKRHLGELTPQAKKTVKRHICSVPSCGKSFTSTTNLNIHIRRHNGERPYECTECGKTFRSSTTLNDHKRIHTGVKPYMCPQCGARFATNKLSAHMRTHAAREHACPASACERRFRSARAALLHARTHAPPARAHRCALCAARYSHRQSLNKHVRRRHGLASEHAKTTADTIQQSEVTLKSGVSH